MILIIGCGYVGERVASSLHAAGAPVLGVTHSPDSANRLSEKHPFPVLPCDVSDEESVKDLASHLGRCPHSVLHCASSNRGGAEMYRKVHLEGCGHLVSIFPQAHLLFTSSSSVYPQTNGSWVTEESDASPDRQTSRLLRETEELVISHGGAAARLAGIYGAGRSFVLKNFLEGQATIEGNDGEGRCLNQIHRDDAASALVHLIHQRAQGIFNVVDNHPMNQLECFKELVRRFHKPLPPLTAPNVNRKRAWTHKKVSNAKLRDSGWEPRFGSYFDALDGDQELVPSILAQVVTMHES